MMIVFPAVAPRCFTHRQQPNSEKVPDESYALAHTPVTQEENTPAIHQRCRVL